jgi:endonuclease-3
MATKKSPSLPLVSHRLEREEKQAGEGNKPGKKPSGGMTPTQRRRFFERLAAADPHPSTELNYKTPFELLVAVVLSAQATDKSVNKATPPLFKAANTPAKILALGEEGLIPYIQTIGLFRSKARHIIGLCEQLLREHSGKVPSSREALEKLPGVGRKTANVILNVAFGEPTIAVDTHIFRVANRTGLAAGKNVLEVEQALLKNVPKAFLQHAHHWLILHGRYVCTARRPRCPECVASGLCVYLDKTVL